MSRVLKENFRLYIGRYLPAFLLMSCTALATALSVFIMKHITAVVFGSRGFVAGRSGHPPRLARAHYAAFGLVSWTTLARLMAACGRIVGTVFPDLPTGFPLRIPIPHSCCT